MEVIPSPSTSELDDGVAIRETPCKSILNRSALTDYSLNCYTGCTHACVYCYARFMQKFHPHAEAWGRFVDVKINAVEVLKRQLRRAPPGDVFMSSACDGWQPIEARYGLTRRCCELLLEREFRLHVLTKSRLVLRDLDLFAGRDVSVGVTITTPDERMARVWEPGASRVSDRWHVLEEAKRRGLSTSVMLGPLLPHLSDGPAELETLLREADARGASKIWIDALNLRPRVWPALAELLRQAFPTLAAPYRRILYDGSARSAYLDGLKSRIDQAVAKTDCSASVHVCF